MLSAASISPSAALRRIHAAALKLFTETGATRVNVSELAAAAGMARGTIYGNVPNLDSLFEDVAAQLAREMVDRVMRGFEGVDDPAHRMAIGIRQYIRRAHEEPPWGRFMHRFGLSLALLQAVSASDPVDNMKAGIASGRYKIAPEQIPAMVCLVSGGTLAAMLPVLEGHATWRDVGSETAELILVALGIPRREAKGLARAPLPPLDDTPS
ncbi:MAG TPA: TetR/AcrR family transcriptional regulator [Burkholderiaceae bacterium]|nr:TetR/AcrR family transcriptional regulator [Burkholderiaceae bacterium]